MRCTEITPRSNRPIVRPVLVALALALLGCGATAPESGSELPDLPDLPEAMPVACGPAEAAVDRFCLHGCPADRDALALGLQLECAVVEVSTEAGATTTSEVPRCDPGGALPPGASACFVARVDQELPAACADQGWVAEIEVVRVAGAVAGCRIEAECAPSPSAAIDCPDLPVVCGDGWCGGGETCIDCATDCGACGSYAACTAVDECSGATPHCAALDPFGGEAAICTAACDETHRCPGSDVNGARAQCLDGACLLACVGDFECPAGTACRELGPIAPGPTTFCAP